MVQVSMDIDKQVEQDLAVMSNESHKIMTMSMKEIERIPFRHSKGKMEGK